MLATNWHIDNLDSIDIVVYFISDYNECNLESSCDPTTSTCSNFQGGYTCDCKSGFEKTYDGLTCTDIDECKQVNSFCQQKCANTDGSYKCDCYEGYTLNADKKTCRG